MLFAQQQKLNVIEWIKSIFNLSYEKDTCISKDKMIGEIIMKFGSTKKKAEEYIRDLIYSGFINEVAGTLALNKEPRKSIEEEFKEVSLNA